MKFRPGVGDHDFKTKLAHARRFLADGRRTKVTMMFRRRDLRRPENGRKVLERVIESLQDVAKVEILPSKIENRDLTMVLVPKAGVGHTAHREPPKSGDPVKSADGAKAAADKETRKDEPAPTSAAVPAETSETVTTP